MELTSQNAELPSGWTHAPIESIIPHDGVLSDGDWVESKDQDPNGDVRLIQLADVGDGKFLDRSARFLTSRKAKELRCTYLRKGDILVARMPDPIGRACIFPFDNEQRCVTVVDVCIIRADQAQVDRTYLLHVINYVGIRKQIEDLQSGTTRRRISRKNLTTVRIPLPPSNEQRRISTKIERVLSELNKGVALLRTAREQLGTYRQAVLKNALSGKLTAEWREEHGANIETSEQSLDRIRAERGLQESRQLSVWKAAVHDRGKRGKHGRKPSKPSGRREVEQLSSDELSHLPEIPTSWQYVRLSEIAHIGSGMSVSKSRKLGDPIEIPYLSVANVQRGALDLSSVKSMHIERADLPALALKRWDVLFNEGGDRDKLGRGWIWESQVEPCITQNHVFRASPFLCSVEHSKWISHWGNSFGQRYFETQGKQTTNLASINKTVLSKFPIPLPPVIEQVEILRRLDLEASRLSRMDQNITAALRKLDALRQAILKKAFSGGLVPQDPSDEPASVFLDRIRADRAQVTKRSTPRKTGKRRTPKTTV